MMFLDVPTWFIVLLVALLAFMIVDVIVNVINMAPRFYEMRVKHNMLKGAWHADREALERARTEAREAQDRLHELEQFCARRGLSPTDINGKPL